LPYVNYKEYDYAIGKTGATNNQRKDRTGQTRRIQNEFVKSFNHKKRQH